MRILRAIGYGVLCGALFGAIGGSGHAAWFILFTELGSYFELDVLLETLPYSIIVGLIVGLLGLPFGALLGLIVSVLRRERNMPTMLAIIGIVISLIVCLIAITEIAYSEPTLTPIIDGLYVIGGCIIGGMAGQYAGWWFANQSPH